MEDDNIVYVSSEFFDDLKKWGENHEVVATETNLLMYGMDIRKQPPLEDHTH